MPHMDKKSERNKTWTKTKCKRITNPASCGVMCVCICFGRLSRAETTRATVVAVVHVVASAVVATRVVGVAGAGGDTRAHAGAVVVVVVAHVAATVL